MHNIMHTMILEHWYKNMMMKSADITNLCLMADKTELWRQVNQPWRSPTEQPFWKWWSVAGFPQGTQAGFTWLSTHLCRFVAVGAVSVVAWRAKRSSASLQLWISCCDERSWCMWLDQSIHLPCNWCFRRCSSCSATSMSRMYLFTCFWIVCGERGEASVVPAVGSKAVHYAELETTVKSLFSAVLFLPPVVQVWLE